MNSTSEPPPLFNESHERGIMLARDGRFDEAIQQFEAAILAEPGHHAAIRHLALACTDAGRGGEAETAWLRYLEQQPDSIEGYRALGTLRKRAGQLPQAVEDFQKVVVLEDKLATNFVDLAGVLFQLKRHDEAKRAYQRALELDADCYDALINFAMFLQETKAGEESLEHLRKAIALRPNDPSGRNNMGVVLSEQGKFDEAITCYEQLLADTPHYALAWNNLGNALRSTRRNEEALEALKKALALKPDYTEAFNNLGIIYTQLERYPEAVDAFNRALLLRPDYPEAHANRGLVYLLLGDFQKGWADYEWRWQGKSGLKRRQYPGKPWDGSPLAGKRLLLYFEQGLGDTFQFIRYAKELKARGATVILECQRVTRQILDRTPGIDEFVVRGEKPPVCDFYAPVLGLPGLCQTDLDNLPHRVPYVFTDPAMVWEWKQRLVKLGGFKVGIVWQGNPEHKGDRNRSIPLKTFADLANVPGVRLITLQKNFGVEQIDMLDGLFPLTDFKGIAEDADGFLRTGAIIANLDLVVSADTSVAHLAGAMGTPVWLALPTSPDWRWLLERNDTPWYPTMRLFRQEQMGDWCEVFERIANALAERVSVSAALAQEPREVVDQIEAARLLREAGELIRRDQTVEATALLEAAVKLDANNPGIYQDLGVSYAKASRYTDAIRCFRQALKIVPDAPELYSNLGLACLHASDIERAIDHLRRAIWLGAGSADVHKNLGRALSAVPDPAGAEDAYWAALRLRPDDAETHYHLSTAMLAQGKFEQGWLEHEWRLKWLKGNQRRVSSPRWSGQDLNGKRILLRSESDPRDTFIFARYADLLKQRGAQIVLECDDNIAGLMAGCRGVDQVIGFKQKLPNHDYHANLLSLPAIFATTPNTVPASRPYLGAKAEAVNRWELKLKETGQRVIGVALEPDHGSRPTELSSRWFRSLSRFAGRQEIAFADLQDTAADRGQRDELLFKLGALPECLGDRIEELAAVIRNVELLITVDNQLAHCGAAMGVPVWLVLPAECHHRWQATTSKSPWYPTVRLFRQKIRGDWDEVLRWLLVELENRLRN